jgi:hypothetical protein
MVGTGSRDDAACDRRLPAVAERQPPDGARSETEAMFPRRVMRLVDRMSGTPAVDAMFASLKRRAQLELLGRR